MLLFFSCHMNKRTIFVYDDKKHLKNNTYEKN